MAYESMSFSVGFNAEYGGIQNTLFHVQKKLDKTMEKLSTGHRINDMKDDEGGRAIADTMRSWKSGTDESIYNLKEFITMTKVAEKALNDIQDILFEMKQTVDRLQGIEEATDRSTANTQLRELAMAINKIVMHTEYKGFKLFNVDGAGPEGAYLQHTMLGDHYATSHSDRFIRYGAGAEDYLAWDLGMDPRAQQLGMVVSAKITIASAGASSVNTNVSNGIANLYLNGKNLYQIARENGITFNTTTESGDTIINYTGIEQAIRLALGENVKVDVYKDSAGQLQAFIQTPGEFTYGIRNSSGVVNQHVVTSIAFTTYEREFDSYNPQVRLENTRYTNSTGLIAGSAGNSGDFYMDNPAGDQDIAVIRGTSGFIATDDRNINYAASKGGLSADTWNSLPSTGNKGSMYTGVVGNRQQAVYFPNVDGQLNDLNPVSSGKNTKGSLGAGVMIADEGLFDINVMTNEAAALARVQVEAAIAQIDELRGVLAAMQHQAESLINQRMEESVAAEAQISHITDTDYAKELAEFTRQQIAQQAGVNMLAQKRQMAQLITQLLR
jgi:flagellin